MGNLLSINSYHYRRGGSDAVYFDHAKLFSDAGWQTSFYSMHHPKNQPSEWSKYFIDELEFGGDYSIGQKLAMAAKAIYSFEAQRKLRWLLSEHRVDVAHLHCIYHHHSPSILPVLKAQGIPVVLTAHDLKIACPAYKMLNHTGVCEACNKGSVLNVVKHRCVRDSLAASAIVALESGLQRTMRMYERHVDRIVVPSLFFLEKFVEWGWPRERFVHIPNFVDVGHLQPDYRPGNYFLTPCT
jgi:glycosyltransferase involved in cell wall biosynthesis